ncbi:hypothetical protein AB0B48_31390 [Micromonospora sp. NPDC049089]|uniref:hypothetical protein n=1 Tax=unclassified Micromonospora TaxID=2617518 RepID=UPI0033F983DA
MLTASVWRGKSPLLYFGIGLFTGAVVVAVIAAVVGGIAQSVMPGILRWILLGAIAAVILAREFGLVSFRIPENRRLVPESVTSRGPEVGGFQFGFEMGTGMRTYSPSALPHLLLIAILLVVPFIGALCLAFGFAVGRWIMAAGSVGYDEDGTWSLLWARYARLLVAAMAVVVVIMGVIGLM